MGKDGKGRFVKGRSGNPAGRPKGGEAITDLFRSFLAGTDPGQRVSRKRLLVEELYRRAIGKVVVDSGGHEVRQAGSDDILKYIVNRLDGMPKQAVDLEALVRSEDTLTVLLGTGISDAGAVRIVEKEKERVLVKEEGVDGADAASEAG